MRGGACFWREDITSAIRQFPNPILIDLDGTLVEQGNREKINPQAEEALTRAEKVGSGFIVTSGLVTINYLKRLGLAGDLTVLITRKNYPEDTPAFSDSEVQKYIAMQQRSSGRNYNPADFRLEDCSVKHLAPLFMQPYPIPLIDNSVYPIYLNPGIYGIAVRSWPYSQTQRSYLFLPDLLANFQDLCDAAVAVEDFYTLDLSARQLRAKITRSYIVDLPSSLYQKGQLETPTTPTGKYTHIAIGMNDLLKNIGGGLFTEITGHSTKKYYLQQSMRPAVLDGPIRYLNFRTDRESWSFSLANSPITQGINHGFNCLTYSRNRENKLVAFGYFNMEEAGDRVLRANPGAKRVDVFQEFENLLFDILP